MKNIHLIIIKNLLKTTLVKEIKNILVKKKDLIQILPKVNINNKLLFKYKEFELILFLKDTIVLDSYDLEYFYKLPPIDYYGNIFSGKNKIIDSICLSRNNKSYVVFPKHYFHDLLDININDVFQSYRPIECYYDKKNEWLCLYVSGKLNFLEYEHDASIGQSYIAKFILDLKSRKIYRLVIPSSFAFSYGWLYCENFWPF